MVKNLCGKIPKQGTLRSSKKDEKPLAIPWTQQKLNSFYIIETSTGQLVTNFGEDEGDYALMKEASINKAAHFTYDEAVSFLAAPPVNLKKELFKVHMIDVSFVCLPSKEVERDARSKLAARVASSLSQYTPNQLALLGIELPESDE